MKIAAAIAALLLLTGFPGCDRGEARPRSANTHVGAAPRHAGGTVAVTPVAADALCVTKGEVRGIGSALAVDVPAVRAVAQGGGGDSGALRFTYRGATRETSRLASGSAVQQLGLKLRAANGCNVVYAMWRFAPEVGLEVKVKRNPGERTHAECGTDGYRTIRATFARPLPAVEVGSEHTLHAEITVQILTVWADGDVVWEGDLGADVRDLAGPVGFRLDNTAADLELLAGSGTTEAPDPSRCAQVTGD
jgi:hypothetical protein